MISITEIILIIVGFVAIVVGYVIPAGKGGGTVNPEEVEELVQDKLDKSLNDSVRRQIDGMAQDAVADAIDDNRLSLSRMSNEKVMEISEYAGTVLDDIKKNHDEVVFMYDMLNDKHKNLTNTVTEMTKTAETAKQTVRDAELTAKDVKDAAATLDAAAARAKEEAAARLESQKAAASEFSPAAFPEATPAKDEPTAVVSEPESADPEEKLSALTVIKPRVTEAAAPAAEPQTEEKKQQEVAISAPPEEETKTLNTPNVAKTQVRHTGAGEPMSQNKRIIEMHKAGKSNMVIARELGLGIGEVRLVIDLSKKQQMIMKDPA